MTGPFQERMEVLSVLSKLKGIVECPLGQGSQGTVYRVRFGDTAMALKWYHPTSATVEQRTVLETLIRKGPPGVQFLWPADLATARGVPGFGYLMPLRDMRFQSLTSLMKRGLDLSFRELATAGLHLAEAFLALHAQGLCYRDISFGNVFLDPATGKVLVTDNDNVSVDGQPGGGVLGTPRFMAPEIVRGEALPNIQTDQHSLAVLLFYLFFRHHPLEGTKEAAIPCLDGPALIKLHGTEPVYVADPQNDSNRPVPGLHDNVLAIWHIYPPFVKRYFKQAFTVGLHDPANRVKESEWRSAMVRLRDCLVDCAGCGSHNFCDPETLAKGKGALARCWSCKQPVGLPPCLIVGGHRIMLTADTKLYPHHLDDRKRYDFTAPVAEVTRHPTRSDRWGLKNLSPTAWTVTMATGQNADVAPGRSVAIASDMRIRFERVEGIVSVAEPVNVASQVDREAIVAIIPPFPEG